MTSSLIHFPCSFKRHILFSVVLISHLSLSHIMYSHTLPIDQSHYSSLCNIPPFRHIWYRSYIKVRQSSNIWRRLSIAVPAPNSGSAEQAHPLCMVQGWEGSEGVGKICPRRKCSYDKGIISLQSHAHYLLLNAIISTVLSCVRFHSHLHLTLVSCSSLLYIAGKLNTNIWRFTRVMIKLVPTKSHSWLP